MNEELQMLAQKLAELEKKRDEHRGRMVQDHLFDFNILGADYESVRKKPQIAMRFQELEDMTAEIQVMRDKYTSLLLHSINESSNRLEAITKNLKQSSDSGVMFTTRLLRSSKRLERLTLWLLLLTATNVYVIAENQIPFPYSFVVVILLVTLLVVSFAYPRKEKEETNPAVIRETP